MLGTTMARLEAEEIQDRLSRYQTIRGIARSLHITEQTLRAKIARYGLTRPERPKPSRVPHAPAVEPENPNAGVPCETFHAWALVLRQRARRRVVRVWHCRRCPAVQRDMSGAAA